MLASIDACNGNVIGIAVVFFFFSDLYGASIAGNRGRNRRAFQAEVYYRRKIEFRRSFGPT